MEHKTKYKQLTEAYLHALGVITESTATWAEFLCSAAYTYEERFQSQVLLHHQRPGVKAVATLNQWDREKNRHIVRGTHGIPVFDAKHPECLTYVFDYQDTAGRSTPGLLPWTVYENKSGIARHNLLRRSGEKSLDSYVHTKVQQIVDTEVKSETSAAMRTELQKFLEQSAKYVVYTRLNMPVDNLDTSAFSFATQYQNRPKVLERLGTLLSHSLVACLSPVRDIAQAMHMTMPPPEGLAVQKKDTRTRSVPETSEVTAEASPEAPREWGFYVIPDLKTWATNSSERTPIEHYETFEEARDRFAALRDQPYNKTNDLNDDGQPYAHLTLGLESKDKLSSVDILQVRAGQNYLVEDFTRMQRLRADSVVLENLSRVAREIGFDRVRPYVMENGSYKALPDMPFSQWENPYFTVDPPEQGDTFTIYQLKGGSETRDYRFEPYESLQEAGLAIDRQNYDLVYTAPLDGKTTLEDIFRTFNLDRPADFTGHSLSVSDIVVLNRGGDTKAYYCDSAGFVDVPSFLEQKIETAVDQPIINEDEIRRALCDGSGFENGKMRIQYYFSQPVLPPREETIRWLKKEYGTGGRSWDFANGSRGWLDYNNKGFEIQCNTDNGQISHTLTWQEVSSRLQELVQSNRYLTDAEYPEYEEWLSARQAEQDKRAADLEQAKEIIREYCTENGFDPPEFEDLRHIDLAYSSTGEGDHSINVYVDLLHHKIVYNVDGERILSAQYASTAELVEHELSGVTFDELIGTAEQEYQERKREQAIRSAPQKRPCIPGDIVYLENDKAFIVQDIGEGEILLQDQELPLFSRSVSKEEFSRLLERNERNSRLQAPATPSIETSEKTKESTAPEQVQPQPIPQKTAVEIPINGEWTKFQTVADAEQAAYEEYKANIARNAQNYKALPDEQREPGGPKARFQDNISALRLLQHLETTGMQATPEQQQLLARYVGWGGLADAFDARKGNWHKEYQELKELLPEAEYEAARASTLTSYYTSPEIVRAMYSTLERFGLQGGNILEPSMGVGAFFANRPASFNESAHLFGVEIDPVTGRIAKQLYPKANIQICGYEKATLPDSYFDVVIGNVPFGQYKVNDPAFNRYNFLIHDYFAAKSIDKLRVGGIQAIITTSGTMDKQTEDVRKYLAARCELIGAVRLPNTAFKALAGTEVTADILFLQKREHIFDQDVSWLHTGTNADGIPMNQYFIDHPEMICGKMEMVSGPYGMRPTCQPDTSTTLEEQLQAAMGRLNATLVKAEPVILEQQPEEAATLPADTDVRNYSYCIRDDRIFFRTDSVMREVIVNATAQARIKGMVSILATTRELIQAQLDDLPDETIAQLQRRLNQEYDAYTEKHGRLSSRANALAMREDSGYSLLCSLEIHDDDRNFKAKSDMFTKRTIRPNLVIDHVETASEALMLSVQERTSVDLSYMEQLTGKPRDELLQELTGVVFRVPGETTAAGEPLYQTGEEYLSGDVRKKLATAEIFAQQDPSYQVNVDSLRGVQPKDLTASEIELHLGTMLNLKVPDLEGGKATAVMCPPTELQKESIQALGERAEKVRAGNVDPHTDNMLKITTDGRKLALDQRLLNPLLPDVPENKATACASKVFEIWQNTMATQSTQLIFSDLATPSTGEWNVYDDIRDKLIAKGIPKEQIAFIHDANTDAKKATLFAKVRAGKVRILMGSTQKMGAGTNVQTKLIALHHLDVPWRPSDIEQREGRILRQGNENPSVQIYRYATEGSFDAYSWQLIENKQKFISQIMTSKSPARSCQDLDEVALSYAEIKALCAGNPLIKEKMELDNEVARLSTLRSSHMSQIFELQDKIAIGYPASIQKVEESLDAVSKDIDVYRANSRFNPDGSEKFSAIVMGTTYTERKAADAALRDALQGATAGDVIIGQYRGFNIHAYYDAKAVSFMGYLQGEQKYNFEFNPKENFSSFRHLLEKLSDTQALDQERLTILNKNLEDAKEAVNQPFAYEKEFQTKLARLNELNTVLNQEGGRTDMHPEIQALLTKIDQTYTAMVTDPQKYLDYLTFRGQCVGMGAENSVAVFAQNPKATYCPAPEAIGSPKVKPGEEDHFVSVLRSDGIERVYALEQYDLPESEYLDKAPLQWTEAQHSDLIHRVEDAAQLADISVLSDLRHGTGFFDASRNVIHIREGNNSTEQLKSLLEGYSEAVITRTSTSDKPVAELESAALTALLQVRCGVPIDDQLAERITAALEDAGNVGGFSMRDSVARLHNAMEYCVRYAELEQTSEQYQAQQIEPEELTPQSEAFMEMM